MAINGQKKTGFSSRSRRPCRSRGGAHFAGSQPLNAAISQLRCPETPPGAAEQPAIRKETPDKIQALTQPNSQAK